MLLNIIHDDAEIGRWDLLKVQLETQGIFSICWPSVKGDISAAHKAIVADAKERGLESVIVCEDDLMFMAKDGWDYFIRNRPKNFDLYLGGLYNHFGTLEKYGSGWIVKRFSGFHLYEVHSRYYNWFLDANTEKESLENAISRNVINGFGKISVCYPYAAVQQEVKSTHKNITYRHSSYFKQGDIYGR